MSSSVNIFYGETAEGASGVSTLVGLLRLRAEGQPTRAAYTFLSDGEVEEACLTYAELDRRARSIAASLQTMGARGERVLLVYPAGLDYVAAFFGCLYAGAVAVPAYPPRQNASFQRLQSIVEDARPAVALTTGAILSKAKSKLAQWPALESLRWVGTDGDAEDISGEWREPALRGDSLAFLQYTSGSTAAPKGVVVTHENLLHNEALIQRAFGQTSESVIAGWLPLYHDMGLIGNVLQALYSGARCVLMSPVAFLQSPFRWLSAISRYRATTSGGPNFAYELCVNKITAEQRALLDLSSWEVAFNGAEPVRAATLERFAEAFGPCGFRREAFRPCYGLAEATLLVSVGSAGAGPAVENFDSGALVNNRAAAVEAGAENSRALVGCGEELRGAEVVIVDPDTLARREDGRVGEIWVAGGSVARGYWDKPDESEAVFGARLADTGAGPFLRTGDLGFKLGGELFITGRLKDLIIIRGLNHYPHDIELTAERSHGAVRPGCAAAFSVEVAGDERLALALEVEPRFRGDFGEVVEAVRTSVAREHEVQPHAVVLIRAGTIPKTSSGKVQRGACRALFLGGRLNVVAEWVAGGEAAAEGARAHSAPEGFRGAKDVERWLVAALAARLGVAPSAIDAGRSMLHYGLDSLTAVELAHDFEGALGVSLPMISFLEESSIAELAERAAARLALREGGAGDFCAPGEDATARGLSYGQRTMWFLQQLAPESPAYNIAVPMRVKGRLDASAMRRAFEAVAERHECLRASFEEVDGEPVQRVLEGAPIHFHVEDAGRWGEQAVSDYLAAESLRPFDLASGPLLRVSLLRLAAEEHVLLLVVHHIVADFWSLAVVMQELGAFYEAELAGRAAELPPLPMRYCDYASRQAEALAGERGAALRDYWRRQLAGDLPALNLPYDFPRPAVQTYNGASEELLLDSDLSSALKALGREQGATLYMTLLAAFQVLLHRYTGRQDLLVGTVTAGRARPEWANLVGYFVNPLPLRADFSADESFESFLRKSRRTALSAFEHQDYPFAALVEDLQPERDLSRPPIFHVMFVLQRAHTAGLPGLSSFALGRAGARVPLAGLTVESIAPPRQVAQYDLVLMMAEEGEGLAASLQYNRDLFRPATVARMLGHFRELLRSIVREPARRVSALDILPQAERRQLLAEWNETGSAGTGVCVQRMFEAQAEQTPDALAVVSGAERLTYRELNERADVLAAHLRALGVGPEVLVGVCLERSAKMVLAVLAVLKAGGAYVPHDPSHPAERLRLTLEDSGARVLLTRRGLAPTFEGAGATIVRLDSDWDAVCAAAADAPPRQAEVTGENLAYMIYTSGSTGRPKGVAVRHAGLTNLVEWHRLAYGVTSGDRATLLAGPAFDASVWELWPYLTAGASLHVPEEATRASAQDLLKWLAAEGVTVSFLPTALAEAVLAEQMPSDLALRVMLTGGDKLHRPPPEALPFTLVNHYGPTEYTVVATRAAVAPGGESGGPPPIGRAIANTRVYLLDARLQVVPVGVAGELYIGGVGVARGYHERPALTAERFIPDAYSGEPGARLYKTGDLARFLPDGQLEFIARADTQVKVRGFRVELGEIESALCRHASVLHAVILAREEAAGDTRLVAYVVAERGEVLTADELRAFLKEFLPEYMVPAAFVRLEELPLTPNGKVDRKALPAPERPTAEADAAPPASPIEEIVAGIWAQVLGVEGVGASENFFDLGGHSLLATQVVSRVRECFRVELPVRALFESPTVAGLAAEVERLIKAGQASEARPVVPVLRDGKLPLSFAQQRLWFLDRLAPGNPLYNIPAAVRMKGRLDVAVLERSLNEIVRRHESLRTTFAAVEGRPVQVIAPSLAPTLEVIDLERLAGHVRDAEVERLAAEEARRPFDLSAGPLLRASLLKLADEEHVLLFTMHHIVSDGWSMGVLVGELQALYEAFSSGKESPLPEPTVQYADFAHWQQRALEDGLLEPELAYWRAQLRGAQSVLAMPTDRPRPPVQTYNGAAESFTLSEELTRSLKALSLESGATLFMTLLAAFDALLYRHTNQRDISVGTPVAGRTSAETEGLIGLFVNTLVLRTQLSGETTFRDLIAGVRETALAAYVHQGLPFEKLVEELQPERDTSHSPLVQVMFALQNAPAPALELAGLSLELMQPKSVAAKFELLLTMEEAAGGLTGRLEYNTDLFDRETIAALVGRFESLLAGAVAEPDAAVAELPLLTFEERRRILFEFNQTRRDYARATLHGLFEAQAARTPDAVALVAGGERLSYRELDERAERVARELRRLGVGAESLVGVCAGRTAALVAGLLGVLKAGGAYVPLDPQYPAERLALMLEDSRAKVLLTERRLRDTLPAGGAHVICLDEEWTTADELASARADEKAASDENLAYVIYTSGSTGRPKGVAISHRSAATLVRWALETFEADDLRGVLASTSICFDLSIYELFVPLALGGTIILAEHALALPALEARDEVTLVNTVPSAMTELLRAKAVPEGVRVVNLAGEPLAAKLVEDVYAQTRVRDVFNLYGPTEDTTYSTGERIDREASGAPSIGRPIANTSAYILDAWLRPVPVGVTGDLYLSGEGLARGYLGRPDMTAERFMPDPYSTEPGARMYRTGDLARYLRDGRIDFLGRADHQVKIRGFRIELGEIESALSRTAGVRDCVVVARDEASGSKRLVAYLVAEEGADVSDAALRLSLRTTLPEYMVPAAFVRLEELPLTPNGKVDRKALPAPGGARRDEGAAYVAPRTATEELVANVWRGLLGLERISVTDNFFELGGHSLLATQAVAKVGEAARAELPLLLMFESPTVEGFAAAVERAAAATGERRRGPALTKFSREVYRAKAPAGRGVEIPEILKRKRTE